MFLPAILYLLVFLFLIYRTDFLKFFKDTEISPKNLTAIFLVKSLAIPIFYLVYKKIYGGLENFDAGIFYKDAKALNNLAYLDLTEFVKVIFGLHDERAGSYFYNHVVIYTNNWDNGKLKDFFYNDNRLVIRLHALFHFFSFNSYAVHALFSCMMSFVGSFYLYKSFKQFFIGKETMLFLLICFFPALWFYTGALLKESLIIFVMGNMTLQLKKIFSAKIKLRSALWLLCLLGVSFLLKPYLLCFSALCFSVFFAIFYSKIKYKSAFFLLINSTVLVIINYIFVFNGHPNLKQLAMGQQYIFSNASKGGIFLRDPFKLVRLDYDTSLIGKKPNQKKYSIKKNVSYMYWEHSHQHDTLFCLANKDTQTVYGLEYMANKGGSNIALTDYSKNKFSFVWASLYHSLFHPLFINGKNLLLAIASFENLFIITSFFIVLLGCVKNEKDPFLPVGFMFFAVCFCFLVGLTTPNIGAILRYRSPAVVFILLSALYYFKGSASFFLKRRN